MTRERRVFPLKPHERAREQETQLIFPDGDREQSISRKSTANGLELKYPGLKDRIFEARRQGMDDQQIEKYAISIIEKHGMKTLDAIQLSSAIESNADQFVTSDKRLFTIAAKATGLNCLFI